MRWAWVGVWERIFADLIADKKNEYLMIDSTIVRAHQQAAAGRRGGSADPALGRSRGRLSTEIHRLADEAGLPVDCIMAGRTAEYVQAVSLLEGREVEAEIADEGYDSAEIAAKAESLGAVPVIPPRRHRPEPRSYNRELYKQRNRIERCFNRLKQFRRLSTRCCRTLERFAPAPHSPALGLDFSYVDCLGLGA